MKLKRHNNMMSNLLISILADIIGMISYAFPFIGELSDVLWAPISLYINYKLYGSKLFSVVDGFEEILPFTDIIPTITLNWIYNYFIKNKTGK